MKTTGRMLALALGLVAVPALAQEGRVVARLVPDAPRHATTVASTTGPLEVSWGQPVALYKAREYRVHVADFDADGDGALTRVEVPARHALQYEFHVVDHDGDGRITDAELRADHWQ
jgi:hypothetical protein